MSPSDVLESASEPGRSPDQDPADSREGLPAGPLPVIGRVVLRGAIGVGAVLLPFAFLDVIVRIAGRVVTPTTSHPAVIVVLVTAMVGLVFAGVVIVAGRAVRPWLAVLQIDESIPAPAPGWRERLATLRTVPLSSVGWAVGEFAVYTAVIARLFWPLGRLGDGLLAYPVDGQGWAWIGWRVSREMSNGSIFPTHLTDAMHPYSINLLGGDGYLTAWIAGVLNLVADPVLAYNLTQVVAVVLAALAGRVLARTCTDDRVSILVSTAAFAAAPLILVRFVGHQNLIFVFPAALVLAEVVRIVRSDFTRVRWARLTVWLVLAYLSSVYYLLFGLLVIGVAVAYCLVRRRVDRASLAPLGKIAGACALTLLCMSPFLMARFDRDGDERAAGAPAEATDTARTLPYSADLFSSVSPPPDSRNPLLRITDTPRDMETTAYPGLLLLIGLGGLVLVRSRLRTTILVSAVALWSLTLGPTLVVFRLVGGAWAKVPAFEGAGFAWLPYTLLLRVPGLTSLRTPVRSGFWLVPLGAAALAIFLGSVLKGRHPLVKVAVAVAGLLIVVGDMPPAVPFIAGQPSPTIVAAFDRIAEDPGNRSVLVVPDDCLRTWGTSLFEVQHRHPVVGCTWYSSSIRWYSGLDRYTDSEAWESLRCAPDIFGTRPITLAPGDAAPDPGDLTELTKDLDVGWIVLEKQPTQCNPERFALIESLLRANTTLLAEDDVYAVFELPAP